MTKAGSNYRTIRGGLMTGVVLALLCSSPALAQSRQRFDLPAGDAAQQVQALAAQSGTQVLAPNADLAGVRTQPVRGDYTPAEALQRMLAGTGLEVAAGSGGALVITRAAQNTAEAADEAAAAERIIVTGTRIERTGVDTIQAATVTTSDEIARRAYTNVIQALSDTPGFAPAANSQIGTTQANLGIAQSFSNFFGLGSQRTLTLVNGRRFVSSNTVSGIGGPASPGSQVDVNLIPVGLVERIETVAIGGAPVYGSDAISGTVNFILKDDYEGIELTGQTAISERGDAANQVVRGLAGYNFMDGRGNIVVGAEYVRQEGLILSARFPRLILTTAANSGNRSDGLPARVPIEQTFAFFTEGGLPFDSGTLPSDGNLMTLNGGPVTDTNLPLQFGNGGVLIPYTRGARFNGDAGGLLRNGGEGVRPADHALLLSPNERYLVNALGNFDVTDNFNLFFEGSYAHTSGTKLSDLFQFAAPAGAGGPSLTFSIDNPFLPAETRAILARNLPAGQTTFRLNRNLNDVADSQPAQSVLDVWRVVVGARGDFSLWGEQLNWDVAYNYGRSRNESEFNQINLARFLQATDVVGTGGAVQCRNPANGCLPLNLFGLNSFTPEAAAWVIDQGIGISINELEEFTANLGGSLPFGIAAPIQFSVGVAHRSERGEFIGNDIINNGLFLLAPSPTSLPPYPSAFPDAPERGFSTNEIYGETVIRIVDDEMNWPVIYGLELEGAVRYVDHSTAGGAITWSAGGRLQPRLGADNAGLTLRGVFTHAIRSPSIIELFVNTTPVLRAGNDLCGPALINAGPNPTVRAANCTTALAAVGAAAPGAFVPTTNVASPSGFVGGNPDLDNEEADSWSLGVVWEPPFIPRLRLTVDYSEIEVTGAIARFTLATAQAACYDSPNFPNEGACNAFGRLTAAQAAAQNAATGRGNRIAGDIADGYLESYFNSQSLDFRGIIGEVSYRFPIPNLASNDGPGAINLSVKAFNIIRFRTQVSGASPILESVGTLGTPKWRVNGRIGIVMDPIDFDLNIIWTDNVVQDLLATNEDLAPEVNNVPAYTLVNSSLGFQLNDRFSLRFSVRNLFDKDVPYPGIVASAYSVFDPIGRTYSATASMRF